MCVKRVGYSHEEIEYFLTRFNPVYRRVNRCIYKRFLERFLRLINDVLIGRL